MSSLVNIGRNKYFYQKTFRTGFLMAVISALSMADINSVPARIQFHHTKLEFGEFSKLRNQNGLIELLQIEFVLSALNSQNSFLSIS